MTADQTPVENAAAALYGAMPIRITTGAAEPPPWSLVTSSITGDVWREHARAALAALHARRDDIARVLAKADAADPMWKSYRRDADAVLAYLTGEAS